MDHGAADIFVVIEAEVAVRTHLAVALQQERRIRLVSRLRGDQAVIDLHGETFAAEVETGLELAATDIPAVFVPLSDRTYGQTRIIVWTLVNPASPSTPEPSIP